MMTKRLLSISAAVLTVMAAVSGRAADGKLDVVVSIKPMHALVAGVMQGVATPHLLLNDQQSPHHFALKPSQARLLQQADLVFWVDSSLETPMPALLAGLAPHAKNIRFMADTGLVRYKNANWGGADGDDHDDHDDQKEQDDHDDHDDHEGEEGHDDHDDHDGEEGHDDHEGHDHSGADPHFFTDPARMAVAVDGIASFLIANVDGLDADTVSAAAAAYHEELEALDDEVAEVIASIPLANRVLVTNHEVFGHFADRYGFEVAGTVIPAASTVDGSSAGALAELAALIEAEGVPAIFSDVSASDQLAQALAEEVGDIAVVELFTESLGDADSEGSTYIDMIRTNAERIAGALAS